ncbi:MAG TPA: protein kinase [Syntrophales bacterium]|nr:protein kinase [Syntrophales bacterium]HQG34712.1 protein kinase [Syntrophales bacterium]HQI36648.1 protein kinase [Syntrophales bacterium]
MNDTKATINFTKGCLPPVKKEAVAHAHRLGIVHRDLKPANVFILKDGAVKVLDFGLAKELGAATVTTTGQGLGTPAYMAPEVFTGERKIAEIGPEGNVYALGVIAYRLFAGRMPFNLPEDASSLEAVAHLTRHYVLGKQPTRQSLFGRRLCSLKENDETQVAYVLMNTGGDRRQTAEILGITVRQLQRKLAQMREDPYWREVMGDALSRERD